MALDDLLTALYNAKEDELHAKNKRLEIERQLEKAVGIPETWEGSTTNVVGGYKFKITRRMLVKIDADKLIETAKANDLVPQLQKVFRWKPEVNKKEWDTAPDEVVRAFSGAIERKPGKATFDIEIAKEKKSNKPEEDKTSWLF